MKVVENRFVASDGENIFYYKFLPEVNDVKFVFQIVHGMGEHSERYMNFAEFLVDKGAVVYASDGRGHGKNIKKDQDYGLWPVRNGWNKVVDDLKMLNGIVRKEYPGVKNFLFGHNTGSFLVRSYIIDHSEEVDGVLISGTGTYPKHFLLIMKFLINANTFFRGASHRSAFLFKSAFGEITKGYDTYEWLTHDKEIVDKYIADPYNGGIMTNSFYKGLCHGIIHINKARYVKKIRKDMPFYFISGTGDPVGYRTKGVDKAIDLYSKCGLDNVELKLYDGGRHEMLNEINKEEVYDDIYKWLNSLIHAELEYESAL